MAASKSGAPHKFNKAPPGPVVFDGARVSPADPFPDRREEGVGVIGRLPAEGFRQSGVAATEQVRHPHVQDVVDIRAKRQWARALAILKTHHAWGELVVSPVRFRADELVAVVGGDRRRHG